ncbi:MAG: hypothetical protein ACYSWX_10060 [Planctomycetota bacterium]
MTQRGPRAIMYVTSDRRGVRRLVAALERDRDGRLWFVPDSVRITEHDRRGRRVTLGGLLGAHQAEGESELIDIAAHLAPLPDLCGDLDGDPTRGGSQRPPVELRWIGDEEPLSGSSWTAPGGAEFEIRSAPLRMATGRQAALLASSSAPEGPWLRPCTGASEEVINLLRLLTETGIPLTDDSGPFEPWLAGFGANHGIDGERIDTALSTLRERLSIAIVEGSDESVTSEDLRVVVRTDPAEDHVRWHFEVAIAGHETSFEFLTARYSQAAVADLRAVLDARLEPYWLLLFENRAELGPYFAGVVDVRRYLSENLDHMEFAP